MSTITTILSTDAPANSRSVINDNFANLNADKIENSVLDTDVALTADSDAKVATQKATKAYVDAQVAAATTVPTCLTIIPRPQYTGDDSVNTASISGNTTAYVGQVIIPFKITVNKISIKTSAVATSGTYKISMFSESGGTQLFSVTTGNITTAATIYTTAVSAAVLTPGVYYLMIQPVSTASATFYWWSTFNEPFATTESLLSDVTSEPVMAGTYVVTADTAPATITPTSVVESAAKAVIICRLDN